MASKEKGIEHQETSAAALEAARKAAGVQAADGKDEFLPSARPARYAGDFIPQETSGPLLVEDDQMFTEWYNPTQHDVVLEVHIGTDPKNKAWVNAFRNASPAKQQEMKSGNRIFIVRAGQTRQIPAEFDLAIQRTHCLHPQCTQKKDCCKDLDHPRVVIAGLAPQLVCKRWHRVPSLHANLDQARAQAQAATEALARAGAEKVAAEVETAQARKLLEEAKAAEAAAIEARKEAEAELARMKQERLRHQQQA